LVKAGLAFLPYQKTTLPHSTLTPTL
jgi:hypothetical protein